MPQNILEIADRIGKPRVSKRTQAKDQIKNSHPSDIELKIINKRVEELYY